MSNYPPGVTGLEFEIAGPDWDGDMDGTRVLDDQMKKLVLGEYREVEKEEEKDDGGKTAA